MQEQLVTTPVRPSRAQIQPAALELLARHSAGLLATARRYSATPEDAEDAYQRGVEILLTKAPTTTEDELLPWLRTVVRRQDDRSRPKRHSADLRFARTIRERLPLGRWTTAAAVRGRP
jgi:DNA-directed RNA polymerase specialized sigma24 family protein